jgi:hypothetical protein
MFLRMTAIMDEFVPSSGSPEVLRASRLYNQGKMLYTAGDASEPSVLEGIKALRESAEILYNGRCSALSSLLLPVGSLLSHLAAAI